MLATPIQAILGEPVDPPRPAAPRRRTPRRCCASARPLATPISIGGLSPARRSPLSSAPRARAGRTRAAGAAARRARPRGPAPDDRARLGDRVSATRPAMSAPARSGRWPTSTAPPSGAFGHPFDGAGRRDAVPAVGLRLRRRRTTRWPPASTATYKLARADRPRSARCTQDGISARRRRHRRAGRRASRCGSPCATSTPGAWPSLPSAWPTSAASASRSATRRSRRLAQCRPSSR